MPETLILKPGAVSAGGTITLPGYAKPARVLLFFAVVTRKTTDVKHAACAATDAAYSSETTLASISHFDAIVPKTIVEGTPGAGEVALTGDKEITVGDDIGAEDYVIISYIPKGEFSGV